MKNITKVLKAYSGYIILLRDAEGDYWSVASDGSLYRVDKETPPALHTQEQVAALRKLLKEKDRLFWDSSWHGGLTLKSMKVFCIRPWRGEVRESDFKRWEENRAHR